MIYDNFFKEVHQNLNEALKRVGEVLKIFADKRKKEEHLNNKELRDIRIKVKPNNLERLRTLKIKQLKRCKKLANKFKKGRKYKKQISRIKRLEKQLNIND